MALAARPVIGVVSNHYVINEEYPVAASGTFNCSAISEVCDALPLIVPADLKIVALADILAACDGFVLTGGRPNVHPEEYGEAATPAHGTFDRERDAVALGLVRECVSRGQPILGICRGFQEMNVAMGGSLYPEIRELPGRMNHRMPPDGSLEEKFALRHKVRFRAGGVFHKLIGNQEVMTNTLHGQGIKEPGERVIIDGWAKDETPEAIYIKEAKGFALSVQWHPEWNAKNDAVSSKIFEAFGAAARQWRNSNRA